MLCWDDLKPFLAVARTGSTLAASRALKVNQTTVARRVAALETVAGARLFDRLQSGFRLTETGRDLIEPAERVEEAVRQLESRIAAQGRRLSGAVKVTTNEVIANVMLPPIVGAFRAQHPDIAVEIHVGDRFADLTRGEADVAIRGGVRPTDPSLVTRRLIDANWSIYASRGYLEGRDAPTTLADLNRHVMIGLDGPLLNAPGLAKLLAATPDAEVFCRCNNLTNLIATVKAGLGVAPLPELIADREGELVRFMPSFDERDQAIWLVVHETQRDVPRIRAFLDFIAPQLTALKRRERTAA